MPHTVSDPYGQLAAAIVSAAIKEWRVRGIPTSKRRELWLFFTSDWCKNLCGLANFDHEYLLERLEKMRWSSLGKPKTWQERRASIIDKFGAK